MKRIGFLVNPVAGMGGAVGLKGTDGREVLKKAISLGAEPVSPLRAESFLLKASQLISKEEELDFELLSAEGEMGGSSLNKFEIFKKRTKLIYEPKKETTQEDTKHLCKEFLKEKVDLILFCGGDGTARDVSKVIGREIPMLGIPSGVKMHSALFALNPATAASLFLLFLKDQCEFKDAEIMDVDEESFRKGEMKVKLFAYARTPYRKVLLQGRKSVFESVNEELAKDEIARYLEEIVEEKDTLFILGPGTTTARVAEHLGIKKTLLGVDLIKNKTLFAKDVNEKEILTYLNKFKKAKIIVSVIGSQGFVFGRGNQQISAEVIKKVGKNNIFILATPEKLRETEVLRVDTGDENLDKELAGYVRVISGYHEMVLRKIELPQA